MKNTFGKVNLNKIILYLLIVVFLVLALQYAMAFFDLREGKKNKNKRRRRRRRRGLIGQIQRKLKKLEKKIKN